MPPHTFSWRNKASNNPHRKVRVNPPYLSTPTLWTLFLPPSCSRPKPLRPLTNNTHASTIVMVGAPNLVTASNGAHQSSKSTVVDPPKYLPNGLCAAHVPTAFPGPAAAALTELPDDVNRSIGRTYCVGTAGDGPNAAVGIVACNRIVAVDASCT